MRSLLLLVSLLPFTAACVDDDSAPEALDCEAQRAQFAYAGAHAITIDDDGRVFVGRGPSIDRLDPDGSGETIWYRDGSTVFDDLALTPERLFATERGVGLVALDPDGAPSQRLAVVTEDAAPFGIVADRGGGVFVTRADARNIVRRWPGNALVTDVTTSPMPDAIGDLAVAPDDTLLVMTMFTGEIYRLELDASRREVSRTLIAETGLPFSITLDVDDEGRIYYGGQETVYRRAAPYRASDTEVLATGLDAFAKLAVGRGAQCPADVYMTAAPTLAIE